METQRGYVLLFVLILLTVGMLIITPTLAYTSTVLMAVSASAERAERFYAADGGSEAGIWRLKDNTPFGSVMKMDLNGCDVNVVISPVEEGSGGVVLVSKELLSQLIGGKVKNAPHFGMSGLDIRRTISDGVAVINIKNNGDGKTNNIKSIGVWIYRASGFAGTVSNLKGAPLEFDVLGGRSFVWQKGFETKDLAVGESRDYSFMYNGERGDVAIAWVNQSTDIWVNASSDGVSQPDIEQVGIYNIYSTARRDDKQTAVSVYALKAGSEVKTLSWATE